MPRGALPGGASSSGPHEHEAAAGCARRWAFRYELGMRPRASEARFRGSVFHLLAADRYGGRCDPRPSWWGEYLAAGGLEAALERISAESGLGPLAGEVVAGTRACFAEYERLYGGAAGDLEPVLVEEELGARIGDLAPPELRADPLIASYGPCPVTARIDLLAREGGALWVVDHKTTAKGDARLPRWTGRGDLRLSLQLMLQLALARRWAELRGAGAGAVRGVKVNRVKVVPPYDFDRPVWSVPPLAFRAVPLALAEKARAREQAKARLSQGLPLPPALGDPCFGRYGECDYADLCAAGSEAAAEALQELFTETRIDERDGKPG